MDRKSQMSIFRSLQHLNKNKPFISRTIARYRDTGSVASRPKTERNLTLTIEMGRKVRVKIYFLIGHQAQGLPILMV